MCGVSRARPAALLLVCPHSATLRYMCLHGRPARPPAQELSNDKTTAELELRAKLGTLRYLLGVKAREAARSQAAAAAAEAAGAAAANEPAPEQPRGQGGPVAAEEDGEDACPICHDRLGLELVMLPCAHRLCCKCSLALQERQKKAFQPQVGLFSCRSHTRYLPLPAPPSLLCATPCSPNSLRRSLRRPAEGSSARCVAAPLPWTSSCSWMLAWPPPERCGARGAPAAMLLTLCAFNGRLCARRHCSALHSKPCAVRTVSAPCPARQLCGRFQGQNPPALLPLPPLFAPSRAAPHPVQTLRRKKSASRCAAPTAPSWRRWWPACCASRGRTPKRGCSCFPPGPTCWTWSGGDCAARKASAKKRGMCIPRQPRLLRDRCLGCVARRAGVLCPLQLLMAQVKACAAAQCSASVCRHA